MDNLRLRTLVRFILDLQDELIAFESCEDYENLYDNFTNIDDECINILDKIDPTGQISSMLSRSINND